MTKFIISCALTVVIFIASIAMFIIPRSGYLENERRKITDFPTIPSKIRAKEIKAYFRQIDSFFTDHFPLRDSLLSMSTVFEAYGDSLDINKCYTGRDNWLFLGNNYVRCVDQLQGLVVLSAENLRRETNRYRNIQAAATKEGSDFIIFIGPNKSSVYPEYLPPVVTPARQRFVTPLIVSLQKEGIKCHDPTDYLKSMKHKGLLYYRSDTHWNALGAHEAFDSFRKYAELPKMPLLTLSDAPEYYGDLVGIGGYKNFIPLPGDNYILNWNHPITIQEKDGAFINSHATTNKSAWVFGDSFAAALKPYIIATFESVHFYSHGEFKSIMSANNQKPDMIIWIIVERNFAQTD